MQIYAALGALAIACATSGCGNDEIKWTEEVQLQDGKVVQLKRRTEVSASGFPVQRRGFRQYNELCYPPLGIHWKSKAVYVPHVFDIVGGKAYVKVPITGCTECMLHDYPSSDALHFVWEAAGWRRIEAKDFPSKLGFNLLNNESSSIDRSGDAKGLVTLAEKQERDAAIYYEMKVTGRPRAHKPGACDACRKVRVTTDQSAEVFAPASKPGCNW
jgi:hypothetical protein